MKRPALRFAFLPILGLAVACASAPDLARPVEIAEKDLASSSVEISYALATTRYQLSLVASEGRTEVVNRTNERTVGRRALPPTDYLDFANRASRVAAEVGEARPASEDCKTPFTLRVAKAGATVQSVQGCRSGDPNGRIGRLIQEGEWLLLGTPQATRTADPAEPPRPANP